MTYNLEVLKKEYTEYQQKYKISQNQIIVINTLYDTYQKNNKNSSSLSIIIEDLLSTKEVILLQLTRQEAETVISHFNKILLPVSNIISKQLVEHLDFSELSTILGREINHQNDITRGDYYRLVNNPKYNFTYCLSHFNIRCKDTIIKTSSDYELGYQDSELCQDNKLYYLKFYDFMMIDYDNIDLDEIKQYLTSCFNNINAVCFYIYKTYKGYHLYYMSKPLNHTCRVTCHLMKRLNCDLWYILFSHKNGFKIRLSKKKGRGEKEIQTYIDKWGNGPVDPECEKWLTVLNNHLNNSEMVN